MRVRFLDKLTLAFLVSLYPCMEFSQTIIIKPQCDSMFYDSKEFTADSGKLIYVVDLASYDQEKGFFWHKWIQMSVRSISIVRDFSTSQGENEFSKFSYDRFISADTINVFMKKVSKDSVYSGATFYGTTCWGVQFKENPIRFTFDSGERVVIDSTIHFDLNWRLFYYKNRIEPISEYASFVVDYEGSMSQTFYSIYTKVREGYGHWYFVVMEGGAVERIYQCY